MPITVTWDDETEKRIVYIRCEGVWNWSEYDRAAKESFVLVASVFHRVDLLVHMLDAAAQRPPVGSFTKWRHSLQTAPPNYGITILVPGNFFVNTFMSVFNNIMGKNNPIRVRGAPTLEAARQLSAKLRQESAFL
jgi:hypothetical protein